MRGTIMQDWTVLRGGTERVFTPGRVRVGQDFGDEPQED